MPRKYKSRLAEAEANAEQAWNNWVTVDEAWRRRAATWEEMQRATRLYEAADDRLKEMRKRALKQALEEN